MYEWYSERFRCLVRLTEHAMSRMKERQISKDLVGELIETGEIHHKDKIRVWVYKEFDDRNDNLICAAVVMDDKLIIKTIMHGWQLMEEIV